jgi:hypothetical protein
MKQIQDEWKQIGHVPRKYSDKIWKSLECFAIIILEGKRAET